MYLFNTACSSLGIKLVSEIKKFKVGGRSLVTGGGALIEY